MAYKSVKYIRVRFQFEFEHKWADAPEEVAFLRYPHRHMFHASVVIEVFHDDRELEFIMVKRALQAAVEEAKKTWLPTTSCEQMAEWIGREVHKRYGAKRAVAIEVSEDGENGALLEWPAYVESN